MESVIQFKNVAKKYRGKVALNDVSYSVPKGVVFALLGDNGAGKTTSIKTMLGFVKQTKDTFQFWDSIVKRMTSKFVRASGTSPNNPVFTTGCELTKSVGLSPVLGAASSSMNTDAKSNSSKSR